MSPKVASKGSSKSAPKPSKTPKKALSTPSGVLAHWLQDVSLEVVQPLSSYAPGERELELSVRANQVNIAHPTHSKLELRLRAHIVTPEGPLVLAEILYAGVIDKTRTDQDVGLLFEELYQPAKQSMEGVLALSGHTPPLPEALQSNPS